MSGQLRRVGGRRPRRGDGHDGDIPTACFTIGDRCKVFDEFDEPVLPGSGKMGFIAMLPPIRSAITQGRGQTAKTFRTIGGVRYRSPATGAWSSPTLSPSSAAAAPRSTRWRKASRRGGRGR